MEHIYRCLENVKAEMEKLQIEYNTKTELFESLKEAHNAQLLKLEEAQLLIEKQAQVIDAQSEEIFEARKSTENLKTSLQEKELSLRDLSSLNDKLHSDWEEKLYKLEDENEEMELTLDKAFSKNTELKQKLYESNEEIVCLKRLLEESEKKNLEMEKKVEASKELGKMEDAMLKLEEGNRNIREQLKLKQEQVIYLEEAHTNLQNQFQLCKEECEREQRTCHTNLIAKESEWSSRIEQLKQDIESRGCEIKRKQQQIQEAQVEMENLHSAIEILKEENYIILTVLQSEFSEAYSNLQKAKAELELLNKDKEDKIIFLTAQLEISNSALSRTNLYLEGYHSEVSSFFEKVKLLDLMEQQPTLSEEALNRVMQGQKLDKQARDLKKILKDDPTDGFESLDKSKSTLPKCMSARLYSNKLGAEKATLSTLTSLEKENQDLNQKPSYQETLSQSKQETLQLCASPKARELETENCMNQSGNEQKNMEGLSEKLEIEKGILHQESMRRYAQKKDMLSQIEEICVRVSEFSCEDVKLLKILEKILQSEKEVRPGMALQDELCDSAKDNAESLRYNK